MAVSKRVLKDLECKYKVEDIFTDGRTNYTIQSVRTRDQYKALLKEPMYNMERFPDEIYRNGKLFLKLNSVEMSESQINKLLGLTWTKVD